MKTKMLMTVLLISVVLVSCTPTVTVIPPTQTAIATSTLTITPAPTVTKTITPTLTPEPTPIGGGTLKVAFYAHDGKDQFLIVGDYFSGKIDYKIPVQFIAADNTVSWSPNGSFLLFMDMDKAYLGANESYIGSMRVNLLNIKTGQVFNLSSHPTIQDHRWNSIRLFKWSPDGQHILYYPSFDNKDSATTGAYVASVDGTVQIVEGIYSDWLPDNKTIVAVYDNSTFNVIEKDKNKTIIHSLNRLNVNRLLPDYIVLDVLLKDRIIGILYPKDLNNNTAWLQDALSTNKVDVLTFSPEIKKPKITEILSVWELPNSRLAIVGSGSFSIGTMFGIIIDKKNLPGVVTKENLYMNEYPVALSPDGQFVLLADLIIDKNRKSFPNFTALPNFFRFKLKSISGKDFRSDDNLSQFNIADTYISNGCRHHRSNSVLCAIDFYWQP